MSLLIVGLVLFLGVHSVRIFADRWRGATIARIGEGPWKLAYSVLALAGLWLVVRGYGAARLDPVVLWEPPRGMRHLAAALTLPAFVLLVAAYVPGNRIRRAVGHPMVLGVGLWALAHLLANGTLADLLLFGGFLAWAMLDLRSARRRDRAPGPAPAAARLGRDLVVLAVGLGAWALFAFRLHASWFGVAPLA